MWHACSALIMTDTFQYTHAHEQVQLYTERGRQCRLLQRGLYVVDVARAIDSSVSACRLIQHERFLFASHALPAGRLQLEKALRQALTVVRLPETALMC